MRKFTEITHSVEAMRWDGFVSMPELVEMKGDAINILARHDESILIFDNAYMLDMYTTVYKGDWIVKVDNKYLGMSDSEFRKKYIEVLE